MQTSNQSLPSQKPTILFVDDDIFLFHSLKKQVPHSYKIINANSLSSAKHLILNNKIDFAVLDLNLTSKNNRDGFKLVQICKKYSIPSVLLTAEDDISVIKKGYQLGCLSFFTKWNITSNFNTTILPLIKNICVQEHKQLEQDLLQNYPTTCKQLKKKIFSIVNRPYSNDDHILLTGPTGVGKSKLANFIHQQTSSKQPFICVSLNEYPEQMIESILFGHKKGSFTGAHCDHTGILKEVDGGTLFLDEIGVLSLSMQQKLLRVLEDKTFYPVGSNKVVKSKFRLITATCDNLKTLIKEKLFRSDLYFRINKDLINITPLKERKEDIELLTNYFIEMKKSNKKLILSDKALQKLYHYSWPGNIRELKNFTTQLLNKNKGFIEETDILFDYESESQNESSNFVDDEMFNHILKIGLNKFIKQIESESIERSWQKSGKKVNQTIRELQISKSIFYRVKSNEKN